jgi:hypothetical protein
VPSLPIWTSLGSRRSVKDQISLIVTQLPSPAQSFSALSPTGLMTTLDCLRFETNPTWRARSPYLYPPVTGWPSYTPRYWVPLCRILRSAGLRWRYADPPPHGVHINRNDHRSNTDSVRTSQGTHYISATKPNRLMLFREKVAVYCENHTAF